METLCIQDIATTTTVSGTREYSAPTTLIAIKRVTWNGRKLEPSDFMDDDVLTGYQDGTTETGTPLYYQVWDGAIYLRPTPDDAQALKIWYFAKPAQVTASTVLEVPEEYQLAIIDFMLHHMVSKDGLNPQLAAYHRNNWEAAVAEYKGWERRKLRKDGGAAVKNLDAYSEVIGIR